MQPSHGGSIGSKLGIDRLDFYGAALQADSIATITAAIPPRPAPMAPEQPDAEAANSPPQPLLKPSFASVGETALLRLNLADFFSDSDGDRLVFDLVRGPDFATISNRFLLIRPSDGDDGAYSLRVRAFDGEAFSAAHTIKLTVRDTVSPGPDPEPPAPIKLTAAPGILTLGKTGAQEWGEGVTLTGYDLKGRVAEVRYSEEFKDHGFGIAGADSRWVGQIDFYAEGRARSEKLVIDFGGPVTDVTLSVGMLGAAEGPIVNGKATPETGKWTAFDAKGAVVDSGLIGPELSARGPGKKVAGSYGIYPIEIDTEGQAFARLAIEATQFGHGAGSSIPMPYGENSSDFNIMALEFSRIDADSLL